MTGIPVTTEPITIEASPKSAEIRRKLRVLFVSHAYVVGVNQGKLNAIAETGEVEVGLLAPSNWKALEWNRRIPLENPYPNLKIYSAPVAFEGKGGAHFYAPWDLLQVLNDFKPDILQVEEEVFSLSTFELAIWCRCTKTPLVVFGWENLERKLLFPRWLTCKYVLNTAQAIIPGNQDGAKVMCLWGYSGLLEVMPQMGIDPAYFAPVQPSSYSKTSVSPFKVGFLGRLSYSKGIDLIFAAASQLCKKGLRIQVVLCGSGPDEAYLRQKAETFNLADSVIWRGAVRHEQVPIELSQFDVLVLPSRTMPEWKEQFGHVLIEAMSMGIPVIGSSSGEIPNVIGRSDLIFQEEDVTSLAQILERMIYSFDWQQEIRAYGLERIHQLYTHDRIAQRLISLWHKILHKPNEADSFSSTLI